MLFQIPSGILVQTRTILVQNKGSKLFVLKEKWLVTKPASRLPVAETRIAYRIFWAKNCNYSQISFRCLNVIMRLLDRKKAYLDSKGGFCRRKGGCSCTSQPGAYTFWFLAESEIFMRKSENLCQGQICLVGIGKSYSPATLLAIGRHLLPFRTL